MKYLLLIITLLLSSPSWGESVSNDDIVKNPTDGLVYKKFSSEPFTGFVTEKDMFDFITKGSYKNGKKHGLWETYFDNGLLYTKENFNNGKEDGLSERYYKNGQLEV